MSNRSATDGPQAVESAAGSQHARYFAGIPTRASLALRRTSSSSAWSGGSSMVEERANLDYGLDDRPIEEAAELPNDDYLVSDRVMAVDDADLAGDVDVAGDAEAE